MIIDIFSSIIFFIAVIHIFLVNIFRKKAQMTEEIKKKTLFDLLGNVTHIFGLWLIPILIMRTIFYGFRNSYEVLTEVNFTEPLAYFILLTIASIDPIRKLFDAMMHKLFGKKLFTFWCGVILMSGILTGIFSEISIMALACWLLSSSFFTLNPSPRLLYSTLSLLLVNISLGVAIIPLNFSSFIKSLNESFSHLDLFFLFGWKAFLVLVIITFLVGYLFKDEFKNLQKIYFQKKQRTKITSRELFYLFLFFLASLTQNQVYIPILILCIIIIFHKLPYRKKGEEKTFHLRLPLAIAFFTYTLEIQGSLQKWWVLPLYEQSKELSFYFYSYFLTGLNEHVPLGALQSILPSADFNAKFFAILGVLAGGGLTIIAKSANILTKLELRKHFPHKTISPFYHLLFAMPITLVVSILIVLLHFVRGSF